MMLASVNVQVQVPRGRLFAFDSEGQHVLTCSSSGGLIYRVNAPSLPFYLQSDQFNLI